MRPLYELASDYQQLLDTLIDEETGEINMGIQEQLNALDKPIEEKCINVAKMFKSLDAQRLAIETEKKAMAKRELQYKAQAEWLKEYLKSNMERCDIKKIECPQFVISLRKNPASVELYDRDFIPDEYKKVVIEFDIAKMRQDMKEGKEIPGAGLVQKNSVQIK